MVHNYLIEYCVTEFSQFNTYNCFSITIFSQCIIQRYKIVPDFFHNTTKKNTNTNTNDYKTVCLIKNKILGINYFDLKKVIFT